MSARLLRRIEAFLFDTKMAESRFGRNVSGDPRLLKNMRNGRQIGPKLEAKIEDYLRSNA